MPLLRSGLPADGPDPEILLETVREFVSACGESTAENDRIAGMEEDTGAAGGLPVVGVPEGAGTADRCGSRVAVPALRTHSDAGQLAG